MSPKLGDQGGHVAHHPLDGHVRDVDVDIDLHHPGLGDELVGLADDRVFDARLQVDAAEVGEHGHLEAGEVVAAEPGLRSPARAGSGVVGVEAGGHVVVASGVSDGTGEAAGHLGVRAG
ncbi:MAG: hypothetical protein U0P45_02980 [Acidimicrobiales bacterium]